MLETSGYDFPRASQEALKEDPKVVETLPWQRILMDQKDASSHHQRPVDGEDLMDTYSCELLRLLSSLIPK